jgi:hypothetical protein
MSYAATCSAIQGCRLDAWCQAAAALGSLRCETGAQL